jgi:putative tryptophan/tyrosine transport system substrate-binding protein
MPCNPLQRRELISLLGVATVAWPLGVCAQRAAMPMVGFLGSSSPLDSADFVAAFRKGTSEAGYIAGQNVVIEYNWAEGQYDRLRILAADLVRRPVSLIVAEASPAALAAKAATATIPIVFVTDFDPVMAGIVESFNQPGGNATGVYVVTRGLDAKRLELLRELVPNLSVIGFLLNPTNPTTEGKVQEMRDAAHTLGQQLHVVYASSDRDFDKAFAILVGQRVGALAVTADPFFKSRRDQLVALAAHHAVPAIYALREFVYAGALMSYRTNIADAFRQGGIYTGQILNGTKPADLPVQQPSKFELVINLKTAKALGLTVPPALLARADEVIE